MHNLRAPTVLSCLLNFSNLFETEGETLSSPTARYFPNKKKELIFEVVVNLRPAIWIIHWIHADGEGRKTYRKDNDEIRQDVCLFVY